MSLAAPLTEEYKALRAEIAQSIVKQHWIAAGGYVLSGTIAAAVLQKMDVNFWGLILVPICFFATGCLWLVECNRMVRASYFIAYVLWPELMKEVNGRYDGWECWIRSEDYAAKKFRRNQDIFQRIKIAGCPFALSCIAVIVIGLKEGDEWILCSLLGLVTLAFGFIFVAAGPVSNLSALKPNSNNSSNKESAESKSEVVN
jgi:hypothetical protein